jgi:tetratricopeptide (TPR) repeat protein
MFSRKTVCAAPLLLAMLSAPAHAEWLEATSKHFTVTGDLSEPILRRRVGHLERFDAVMRLMVPKSTETNLRVLVVSSAAEVRELAHSRKSGLQAFYLPSPFGVFAVVPAQVSNQPGITAESALFHEYVHHLLLSSVDDPMPRWMNEGMAELFMNSRLDEDGSVTIGLGDSARAYSLVRLGRWTAERLFESDLKPPVDMELDQLYAKGWLVLHYLIFSGQRPGEFAKFTDGMKRGVPQLEAARQAFGDLGKLESDLTFYRKRKQLPALRIAPDKLPAASEVNVRHLTPAEAEILPWRMRSMAGVDPAEAIEVATKARPIAERYPDNPFVQRAMAEMEFDARDYTAADVAISRAVAADPDFVDAMAYNGLLLGARAKRENDAALWKQARTWIVKANRLQPDNPLPLVLYFDSFVAAGETPSQAAIDGLMRAVELQPSNSEWRVKVATQLISTGDAKAARGVVAMVAFSPYQPPDNPYAKLLNEIDSGANDSALTAKIAELKIGTANFFVPQDRPNPESDTNANGKPK